MDSDCFYCPAGIKCSSDSPYYEEDIYCHPLFCDLVKQRVLPEGYIYEESHVQRATYAKSPAGAEIRYPGNGDGGNMSKTFNPAKRRLVVISIMLLIAILHIIGIGRFLQGAWQNLYYSYFSDIIMPFGAYLLLCQVEDGSHIRLPWWVKLAGAFLLPSFLETLQYFGISALGVTFDFLDYVAYGIGAASGALVDRLLFPRIFSFWKMEDEKVIA